MHYVDTSALVKLVVDEKESDALRDWIGDRLLLTSNLTRTELMRAVTKVHPLRAARVRTLLDSLDAVAPSRQVLDEAGRLAPATLRSLDAIHLATALTLGGDLLSIVTYDDRFAEAAALAGVQVDAPGRAP